MNLLITTLGTSWQIVPELLSVTNPSRYDFFCGSQEVCDLRKKHGIQAVDETWVVTTTGTRDLEKLKAWAERWQFRIKIFICKDVDSFATQDEILKMRSLIYRVVLRGNDVAQKLYLSLSGGRKTMSADMQEAGNLFGYDAMIHVVDKDFYKNQELARKIREDTLLSEPNQEYSPYFVPLIVNSKTQPSLVVSADKERILSSDYPLDFADANEFTQVIVYDEDRALEKAIQYRKDRSNQLYANFYEMISGNKNIKQNIFRKLYFLHPDILRALKSYRLGKDKERDKKIISAFPKAELHSHLGGVLCAKEIIQVAEAAKIGHLNDETEFNKIINEILSYKDAPNDFEEKIYGDLLDDKKFYAIGIDKYQALGDYQGSSLLQTKETISRTLEIYAENLIRDNVRYAEIRFSPYKYTRLGLSVADVIDTVSRTLGRYREKLEYRLIYIIGRQASAEDIQKSIGEMERLFAEAPAVAEKIAGIDLAGDESSTAPGELRELFMPLLKRCMRITIHAGETEGAESIWEAVYHLSAGRIGHGLKLLDKPELLRHFIDSGIGVEMCPSSNDQIVGFSRSKDTYPLKKYLDLGLKVTLSTDNCGISRTSLTNEFIKASELCSDISLWDAIVLIRNSLSVAFCDRETKCRLMHEMEDEILQICQKEFAL